MDLETTANSARTPIYRIEMARGKGSYKGRDNFSDLKEAEITFRSTLIPLGCKLRLVKIDTDSKTVIARRM